MHILIALLGLATAAAIWWWRIKMAAEATNEVANAVQNARTDYRRWQRGKKAKEAPFEAVQDSREAMAVLMLLIARMDGDYTEAQLKAIQWEMVHTMHMGNGAADAFNYARWLASLAPSASKAITAFAPLLNRDLGSQEKEEAVAMLTRIACLEGGKENAMQQEMTAKLKQQLHIAS